MENARDLEQKMGVIRGFRISVICEWAPLVLGLVLALGLLEVARNKINFKLDEAAFGRDTQNVLVEVDGVHVHCMDVSDSRDCLKGYEASGRPPAVLWLGNSQLAAVNRYKQGDRTASIILHETLRKRGYYLVAYSQPNANLFEHGIVYSALLPKYDLRLLMLPVFLDDFREQGIRQTVSGFLDEPGARSRLEGSQLWPIVATSLAKMQVEEPEMGGQQPLQKKVEAELNATLARRSALWHDRPLLKGILLTGMHKLRNKLLGINSRTKRKVDPAVYREKLDALEAILKDAREHNIRVLVYLPPYRQDIDGPYLASDYALLKHDLEASAQKWGAWFADIDDVVPGPEWATVVDIIFGVEDDDFMHFTAEGHKRHAIALDGVLRRIGF